MQEERVRWRGLQWDLPYVAREGGQAVKVVLHCQQQEQNALDAISPFWRQAS